MTTHDFLTGDQRKIAGIATTVVNVSSKSNWIFFEITLDDGAVGTGEATLHGYEPCVRDCLDRSRLDLTGKSLDDMATLLMPGQPGPSGLVGHAVVSALEQARLDLVAQAAGRPLCALYGQAEVSVPVYANINRGLPARTPDAFAARAADVAAAGFTRIKIAPFDGVTPHAPDGAANEAAVQQGLDRITAVREAIGPDVALMVDCHWRFEPNRALALIDELCAASLCWIECPIAETPDHFPDLARLREVANGAGMKLAGAEMGMGLAAFQPFLALYDVIMPDVKYCGGPAELLRIADAAASQGTRVAPHNPSGPVATAHSVHLAAHPAIDLLELQHNETPLLDTVSTGGWIRPRKGVLTAGERVGLGARINHEVCAAHPWQEVPPPR